MPKWAVGKVTFLNFLCDGKAEVVGGLVLQWWIWDMGYSGNTWLVSA